MLNIWFVLWVFVATFIFATSVWSYFILFKQRRSWEIVSEKCNLKYTSTAILKSPALTGVFNGIDIDIFADKPISGKFRDGGSRTIFQLTLKGIVPTQGMIGSMAFKNFIDGVSLTEKYVAEDGKTTLASDIYNKVRSKDLISSYLTKERIVALNAVMTIKNSPAILIFSQDETLLRIESADPFDDPVRLEKFLTKATEAAKLISP